MKLKDYKPEELEVMSYDDIALLVLESAGKKMKTIDLFKSVIKALGETENLDKVGDFYSVLATNKNFILLDNGFWDLKSKHNSKVVIEDEEEDISETLDELPELKDESEEEEEDIFYETDDTDDDADDDDLKDLLIIDPDEDNPNIM